VSDIVSGHLFKKIVTDHLLRNGVSLLQCLYAVAVDAVFIYLKSFKRREVMAAFDMF
jgi:hypothetical protein